MLTINLYPATIDKVHLITIDKHDPKDYIFDEYSFCRKEIVGYNAAMTIEDREETAEKLYEARVKFAQKMGYIKGDKPKPNPTSPQKCSVMPG